MKYKEIRGVTAGGVISIITTNLTLYFFGGSPGGIINWLVNFGLIAMYFIIALKDQNFQYHLIGELSSEALAIYSDKGLPLEKRAKLIRSHFETFNKRLSGVSVDVYKELTEDWHTVRGYLGYLFRQIGKGTISLYQSFWVAFYFFYRIIGDPLLITPLGIPVNMLFSTLFIMGLQLTIPRMEGLGGIIRDIIHIIKKGEKNNVKEILGSAISKIRLLCTSYTRVANQVEESVGMPIQDFLLKTKELPLEKAEPKK